jgi:hypothetical protein
VPNKDELHAALLAALRKHKPELLECKVEAMLKKEYCNSDQPLTCCWIWTPPYCPWLQPIELFWGCGKNHAADCYKSGRTLRQAVAQLRAGWYGCDANAPHNATGITGHAKVAINCSSHGTGLVHHAIKEAQGMVDGFGGWGVWGSLLDAPGKAPFAWSGTTGECEHVLDSDPIAAVELGFSDGLYGAGPAPVRQHRLDPVPLAPGRKLKWMDLDALARADLERPPSMSPDYLLDPGDCLSEHAPQFSPNDEPAVRDVPRSEQDSGDDDAPLVG